MSSSHQMGGAALLAWAMQRRCKNPHSKLLLIYMADAFGDATSRTFSFDALRDFTGLDRSELVDALVDLSSERHVYAIPNNFETVDAVLPWHRSQPPPPERPFNPQRQRLWELQRGSCWYCGCSVGTDCDYEQDETGQWVLPAHLEYAEIEHQRPRSRGGRSNQENLVLSCRPCNRDKRDKTVEEYRAILIERHGPGQDFEFFGECEL